MNAVKWLVFLLAATVLVLHQDFWNFGSAELYFGFLPIGLAYHAAYSLACAVLMALLVLVAWPTHLEELESIQRPGGDSEGGH